MIINKIIGGGGSGLSPTIVVTAPTGSTVQLDGVTGTEVSGTWTFATIIGSHTVSATYNGTTKTQAVTVDSIAVYPVTISFSIPVTITGTGSSSRAYVTYNGTTYYSSGSFTYDPSVATTMTCKGYRSSSYAYGVYLNGTQVATTGTYTYTPTAGTISITIALTASTSSGYTVYITESSGGRLPSGYIEVEYITSTGTQYINTNFKPNYQSKATVSIRQMPQITWGAVFGTLGGANATPHKLFFVGTYSSTNRIYVNLSDLYIDNIYCSFSDSHVITLDGLNKVLYIDGTNYSSWSGTLSSNFQSIYDFILFGVTNYSGTPEPSAQSITGALLYDNGTLIREFVPCISPSNEVGMYDLVTGTFYGNSGSGVFIAGNPV